MEEPREDSQNGGFARPPAARAPRREAELRGNAPADTTAAAECCGIGETGNLLRDGRGCAIDSIPAGLVAVVALAAGGVDFDSRGDPEALNVLLPEKLEPN